MRNIEFTLFETAIGHVAIAWGARGIVGVQLPEVDSAATRARMRKRFPLLHECTPPPDVKAAMARITHLLTGGIDDLGDVGLDWHGVSEFHRRVYELTRRIPPGETRSYAELAAAAGNPRAVRAAGSACGANHVPIVIPCHRVTRGDGDIGGYAYGADRKRALLHREGLK